MQFQILFVIIFIQIDNAKWQCNETLLSIQWNANGTLLAAVCKENHFFFITYQGNVLCDCQVPQSSVTALTAFTWFHDDRFVIATSGLSIYKLKSSPYYRVF